MSQYEQCSVSFPLLCSSKWNLFPANIINTLTSSCFRMRLSPFRFYTIDVEHCNARYLISVRADALLFPFVVVSVVYSYIYLYISFHFACIFCFLISGSWNKKKSIIREWQDIRYFQCFSTARSFSRSFLYNLHFSSSILPNMKVCCLHLGSKPRVQIYLYILRAFKCLCILRIYKVLNIMS